MDQASTGVAERDRAADQMAAVRPRLRHDVVFAESADGVFLRHSDNGFVLKGKSAYRLVSTLTPHLTGEHTVDELCAGLGDAQAAMVTSTIRTLLDRGFVRDRKREDDAVVPAEVVARFQRQISFIEHYVDGALGRFAAFRASRVLLVGHGEVVDAAALALLRNGLERVHLASAGSPRVHAEAAATADAGVPAEVVADVDADPAEFDLVLVCGDAVGAGTVASLARRTAAGSADTVMLPAVVVGRTAVVGPLVRAEQTSCWFCAMLRIGGSVDGPRAAALWRELTMCTTPATPSITGPAAALIGNALAFDVFRIRTGCLAPEAERAVLTCDLDTLESRRGILLRHPLCTDCADQADSDATAEPSAVTPDDLTPAAAPDGDPSTGDPYTLLIDDRIGLLGGYTDGPLPQSPVRAGRVRLPDPTGAGAASRDVTGFSLDTTLAARDRAVARAILSYVDAVGRRPVTAAGGRDRVEPADLLTWLGVPARGDRWVPATELGSGRTRLVPAAAVHPTTQPAGAVAFEPAPVGGGAGRTAGAAALDGLLSALTHRALLAAANGAPASTSTLDDPDVDLLTRAATLLGRPVRVLDLATDGLGAVALAMTVPTDQRQPIWRVGSGLSRREATVAALRDLVGTVQLAADGVEADLGTPLLAGFDPRAVRLEPGAAPPGDAPEPPQNGAALVERLGAAGLTALVVDTATPELKDAGMTTVRVLLARRRTEGDAPAAPEPWKEVNHS